MKRVWLATVVVLLAMALAGCPAPAAPAPAAEGGATNSTTEGGAEGAEAAAGAAEAAPAPEGASAVIGFTSSVTGQLNVESTRQTNGLNLWMEQVNGAGGVALGDGGAVTFSAKFYDDESNNERIQELYTRLATEDDADFLISPYSSGLTASASVIAEQYGKVMITTGAASDSNYQQGYTRVFQMYTPASKYLTGGIDLLMAKAPDLKKIAIVHENDRFSTDVSTALQAYAEEQGYEIVLFEGYDSGTTDFAPFINKIQQAAPEAIMGGGHFQDGSTFARQLAEKGVSAPWVMLLVAPPEPTFADLGDAALGVVGPSQWEPQAAYSEAAAQEAGVAWYGPTVQEFVDAYVGAYGEEPSYHAAGGYAAGLALQYAIEQAGSLDGDAVKAALDAMDIMTFYGHIRFDTSAESHGLQTGHDMVYVQWQQGEDGALAKQVIWPAEGASAEPVTR